MEQKRSCCSRQICCGMPVEKGCYIFSIINAVIVTASTLASLAFLGFMLYLWLDPEQRRANESNSAMIFFNWLCGVCFVGAVIAQIFAVLLCVGMSKKKPQLVMAYLVYGILTEVASVVGIVAFIWMEWGEFDLIAYSTIFLAACVVYAFLLLLVYQAYVVLSDEDTLPLPVHRKLINTPNDS